MATASDYMVDEESIWRLKEDDGIRILNEIRCSKCRIPPYPYIRYCIEGHALCSKCATREIHCPRKIDGRVCGKVICTFDQESALHNAILQDCSLILGNSFLDVSSANDYEQKWLMKRDHYMSSSLFQLGRQRCPFSECLVDVSATNLTEHFKTVHEVPSRCTTKFDLETIWTPSSSRVEAIVECFGETFLLLVGETNRDIHMWVVNLSGNKSNENFVICLSIQASTDQNVRGQMKLRWESIPVSTTNSCPDDGFQMSRDYLLRRYSSSLHSSKWGDGRKSHIFVSISMASDVEDLCSRPEAAGSDSVLLPRNGPRNSCTSRISKNESAIGSVANRQRQIDSLLTFGYRNPRFPLFVLKPPTPEFASPKVQRDEFQNSEPSEAAQIRLSQDDLSIEQSFAPDPPVGRGGTVAASQMVLPVAEVARTSGAVSSVQSFWCSMNGKSMLDNVNYDTNSQRARNVDGESAPIDGKANVSPYSYEGLDRNCNKSSFSSNSSDKSSSGSSVRGANMMIRVGHQFSGIQITEESGDTGPSDKIEMSAQGRKNEVSQMLETGSPTQFLRENGVKQLLYDDLADDMENAVKRGIIVVPHAVNVDDCAVSEHGLRFDHAPKTMKFQVVRHQSGCFTENSE